MLQSSSGQKWRANFGIYSHALLRIHVIEGQRSVRIASPFLSPHHTFAVMMTGAFGLNVGNWAVIDTSSTLDSVHYCTISFSKFRHCPVSTVLCHVGGQALCVEVSTGLLACWHEWHDYHFLSSIEYGNLIGHTQCQIWCLHFVQSIKVSENWRRVCWFSLSGDMHSCHWTGNDTLFMCC